ncbi:hypothetical protein LB452_00635 [Psychroflexus sp. CAK8W]|uniref:Uncharacterized protein n=1 Tax=Psychroflexus longus TaxID=2873596 RepID=A0ABS7XFX8_9FLAO|nr:hypothetical protein [Psychroflexus longus]MBZ9777414.1 hypothetical protein [Psychroflexus longus]
MPKLFINLFKKYQDLNSSFISFKDFKNLSDYYKLFVFLTDSSSYKLHSTVELMEGAKFYLHKDQLGTPRAKHKIIKRPFKIEIYAYKLFFCGFPVRLDVHFNHNYTFYYRYTFSNSLGYDDRKKVKSFINGDL